MVLIYIAIAFTLISIIEVCIAFNLGMKHYHNKVLASKIAEFTFDLLLKIDDRSREEVLKFIGDIGEDKSDILEDIHKVENELKKREVLNDTNNSFVQ